MKNRILRAVCLYLCVALICFASSSFAGPVETEKLKVVSTIFPPYDFVRQIAGDHVELMMLLPPGSESHSFEPRPQDIISIGSCDVFIYIGGQTDAWVNRILESIDTENIMVLSLLAMVDAVEEEIIEGMEHGHEHDDDHGHEEDHEHDDEHGHEDDHGHDHEEEVELDEHVWTSPQNAKRIVEALCETLCSLDPANAETYRQNTAAYSEEISALDAAFQAVVDSAVRKTVLFGDRFPFRYLVDAYGLSYYAAFPGCATETGASATTIAFLIDKVREEEIPVVFQIEFSSGKIADVICESTGAEKLEMHSCHNVSREDFQSGVTYMELMLYNVEQLKEALH